MAYVYVPSKLNISKYNKMCYFSVLMNNWLNKRSRISTKVDKQWREEHTQRFLSKDYSVENLFFSVPKRWQMHNKCPWNFPCAVSPQRSGCENNNMKWWVAESWSFYPFNDCLLVLFSSGVIVTFSWWEFDPTKIITESFWQRTTLDVI